MLPQDSAGTDKFMPTDTQALNLTHAIALQESSKDGKTPDYNAVGDAGTSKGAYQWQPGNFEAAASKFGLDPKDFSPQNQDKVAYAQVKDYKDRGYQPAEIASMWNSGSPHNYENHSGTTTINGQQVHYDTPKYVQGVKSYYQQLNGGQQTQQQNGYVQPPQNNPASTGQDSSMQMGQDQTAQPSQPSLLDKLGQRYNDASTATQDLTSGNSNIGSKASDMLQAAGAAGGALTDIATPIMSPILSKVNDFANYQTGGLLGKAEGYLGGLAQKAAQSDTGQRIIRGAGVIAQEHPTLAKDAGALGDITGGIGTLEGAGALKDTVGGFMGDALQSSAKKSIVDDATNAFSKTKTLAKSFAKNGGADVLENGINQGIVPGIEGGKYATKEAYTAAGDAISNIEDKELQPALAKAGTPEISQRIPLQSVRQQALNQIEDELSGTGNVESAQARMNKIFDENQKKYGDYPTLQDYNEMKRTVRTGVNFDSPKVDQDVSFNTGQILQKTIEDGAKQLGLPDVAAINQKMGNLIKYQKMLKDLDMTPVKVGKVRGLLQHVAGTGTGAMIGKMTGGGIPAEILGGYIGDKASGMIQKKTVGGLLGRFAKLNQ